MFPSSYGGREPIVERVRGEVGSLLTRQSLMKVKTRAMRQKVWFKTLSRVERAIIDLTIECVEKVRSKILAGTVLTIVSKVLEFLEESFMTRAERVGRKIAERLCVICEKWGNDVYSTWKCDECFINFLGVNALNS